MTLAPHDTPRIDRLGVGAAIAAISIAGIGFGHSVPLFALLLKRFGASDTIIGLNTGTAAVAALLVTPVFPALIGRTGLKPFLIGCVVLMVATYAAFALADERIWLWFPLRFLFGAAGAGLFAGSEIWINSLAPETSRGRIIGIYSTFLALGFAMGPMLVDIAGTVGVRPFIVGMAVFSCAALPILVATAPPPEPPEAERGFFQLFARSPATFLSAAVFAGAEGAILTFLPVLAVEGGLGEDIGARAITVYGLGLVLLQYAIGASADRIGYGRSLLICASASLAGGVGFLWVDTQVPLLFAILFLWGGFLAGLYTVGLTLVGNRYPATSRGAANTGFIFMYALGAIIGPVGAGLARSAAGQTGLEWFLLSMLGAYAALVFVRRGAATP